MPVVVTLLPLAGLDFLADTRTELGLCAASVAFGVSSLCLGYREHRRWRALAVLAAGLSALFIGRILEEKRLDPLGILLVMAGGVAVAGSHALNRALCSGCRTHECKGAEENSR
jgi:drug/metabolite transporter (DMT)-like permease